MVGETLFRLGDKVAFHAVENFNVATGFSELSGGFSGFREGLNDAVVGNCDGSPAPVGGGFDKLGGRNYGVHGAHFGMNVEFDALNWSDIDSRGSFVEQFDFVNEQHIFVGIIVEFNAALNFGALSLFKLSRYSFGGGFFVLVEKFLAGNAVGIVNEAESQHESLVFFEFAQGNFANNFAGNENFGIAVLNVLDFGNSAGDFFGDSFAAAA